MGIIPGNQWLVILLAVTVFLLPSVAAEVMVFEGDSVVMEEAKLMLTWGQDYTFNRSSSQMYADGYYMNMTDGPDRNISITSDTSNWINATLHEYNFTGPVDAQELLNVEVTAVVGSTVSFLFSGIPAISEGEYTVSRDGTVIATDEDGDVLTWEDTDWSTHTYTVNYAASTQDTTTAPSPPTPDHCWRRTGTSFGREDAAPGLPQLAVNTVKPVNGLCLAVNLVEELPGGIPPIDDAYRYYEFSLEDAIEIGNASLTVEVNASFADQYDPVVVSHYTDKWTALKTDRIGTTEEVWTYEAVTDNFSYFAVHGTTPSDEPDDTETADPSDPDEPAETVEETTDADVTDEKDVNVTGLSDDLPSWTRIISGLGLLIILTSFCLGTVISYRYWAPRYIERELLDISETVQNRIDTMRNPEKEMQLVTVLTDAEQAWEEDRYWHAWNRLQELKQLLADTE